MSGGGKFSRCESTTASAPHKVIKATIRINGNNWLATYLSDINGYL